MNMRAKVKISKIENYFNEDGKMSAQKLYISGVSKDGLYPPDGSDEDNTFAKFSPSLNLDIYIANPALFEQYNVGDKFYLNFELI